MLFFGDVKTTCAPIERGRIALWKDKWQQYPTEGLVTGSKNNGCTICIYFCITILSALLSRPGGRRWTRNYWVGLLTKAHKCNHVKTMEKRMPRWSNVCKETLRGPKTPGSPECQTYFYTLYCNSCFILSPILGSPYWARRRVFHTQLKIIYHLFLYKKVFIRPSQKLPVV